jgi:hypothetical protein
MAAGRDPGTRFAVSDLGRGNHANAWRVDLDRRATGVPPRRPTTDQFKEAAMGYRVYSGPHGASVPKALERDRMLFKEFSSLDEAMSWAGHVNDTGLTALLVEGDDGTHLEKQEITAALRHRETERGQARTA